MSKSDREDIHNSEIPVVCQACEARHGGICGALSPSQLSELAKHTQRTAHESDTVLKAANSDNEHFANVLGGVIKLTKLMPDGRQQIVGLQFAPDFLGRPYSKDHNLIAEAATDIRLCRFPKSVLERFIEGSPEMEQRLHEQHMRELDEARDWMLTLGRKTAIEKVASFLILIARHIDPEKEQAEKDLEIELPLKRNDIADFLGLTIETVSRQLTNLKKRGLINIDNRRYVTILDMDKLEYLASNLD